MHVVDVHAHFVVYVRFRACVATVLVKLTLLDAGDGFFLGGRHHQGFVVILFHVAFDIAAQIKEKQFQAACVFCGRRLADGDVVSADRVDFAVGIDVYR